MSVLWTSAEMVAATGGHATADFSITGISIDSRSAQSGDIFVALTDQRDGHDFVAAAFEAGASAALVSRIPEGVAPDAPLLVVSDVMTGLADLARAARARTQARVIAITGSAGKTSTKDMAAAVLGRQGATHVSQASFNNHWGVPLTLARMPAASDFAVIEIGMNHPGEIAPLSRLARPDVAIVTTVALAHLEAFDGIEAIAHEKAAICEGLIKDGTAILNGDLAETPILRAGAQRAGAQIVTFGVGEGLDWRATRIDLAGSTTVANVDAPDGPLLFKIAAPGRHFAMNALAVLAAVQAVGADPAIAAMDLGNWSPPGGRGKRVTLSLDPIEDGTCFELIDDAYNANPASMAAGLEVLAAAQPLPAFGRDAGGRRIAILGDMLELGPQEDALHAAIADLPQAASVDLFHCVGPRMRHLWEALEPDQRGHFAADADALLPHIRSLVAAGDVIFVKGSKSSHVSKLVDAITKLGHAPMETG